MFCISQKLTILVPENHFRIDETNLLILSHLKDVESYNDLSNYEEITLSLNQVEYHFNTKPNYLGFKDSYQVSNSSIQFVLYFTQLPIISIDTQNNIIDEPKVHANFIYADSEQVLTSDIGIEIRGASSQGYPKKTYDLEFWEDNTGQETKNVKFGNLRSDDDWILDALYNEPLRLRSYIANKIWLDMHTPHYINSESNAKAGADVNYVEMFLNGIYNGIYNISEQIDQKQLKLKSYNGTIRGELYKGISWGASTFESLPSYNNSSRIWGGYEMKSPNDDETTDWENLYQFTNFVLNSSNSDFNDNIWNKFNYDNYTDYFIFLNLLRAADNTGKNIYLAKYTTNGSYFYIPWDLDGCFGTIYNGTNQNITNDILTNGLFDRVIKLNPNNYSNTISSKWFEYRNTILKENNLISKIENQYQYLLDNKIYEREKLIYSNYSFGQQDVTYMIDWLYNRLSFLDTYFGGLLSTKDIETHKTNNFVYPNPTNDRIYLSTTNQTTENAYKIYNTSGELIDSGIATSNYISIEKLIIGNYFLIINNQTHKFIVE
ncbi:CotH kinase family protein [Flavobacterium sp. NG2]|uniref:CotH kinase family protein n=1 Tax=Flavobacterium sp. NG2 TaxID=3097547 RepID=UPI002A83F5C2|nr:CotH kinase family protein [Flavobacterium sp. NG2]WPR70539.1 CotH kinase family protein [Flavobacterium sp. NG2]